MSHHDDKLDRLLPLTATTFHILLALEGEDAHGYRIMKDVTQQSSGKVIIGPGTLYEAIGRLRNQGLVEESADLPAPDEDQRRRYYTLTDLGRAALRAESVRLAEVVDVVRARKLIDPKEA